MKQVFDYIGAVAAILMIISILIQSRGASLGAAFGGETELYRSRRGSEKVIFQFTVVSAVVFVLSVILSILSN